MPTDRRASRPLGFSKRQQPIFRALVEAAWRKECAREGVDLETAPTGIVKGFRDSWYRGILRDHLGVYTTKQLDQKYGFPKACAAFEEIIGESIYWQMRAGSERIRQARYALDVHMRSHDIDQGYAASVADKMGFPSLEACNAKQLSAILIALKKHTERHTE